MVGAGRAGRAWDPAALEERGRMPSFFFCAPLPSDADERAAMLEFASPRSRILLQQPP